MDYNNIKDLCHFGKVGEKIGDFMRPIGSHGRGEMMNDIKIEKGGCMIKTQCQRAIDTGPRSPVLSHKSLVTISP